jgi:hypothetical protein
MSSGGRDQKQKSRKLKRAEAFFEIGPTFSGGPLGLELINKHKFIVPPRLILGPKPGEKYGLPDFPELPIFQPIKKNYGRPPKDLEIFGEYWIVSQRFRDVLIEIDPDGVEFADCAVFHPSGKPVEPNHYLCAVIREVDAFDESSSKVGCEIVEGTKYFNLM